MNCKNYNKMSLSHLMWLNTPTFIIKKRTRIHYKNCVVISSNSEATKINCVHCLVVTQLSTLESCRPSDQFKFVTNSRLILLLQIVGLKKLNITNTLYTYVCVIHKCIKGTIPFIRKKSVLNTHKINFYYTYNS